MLKVRRASGIDDCGSLAVDHVQAPAAETPTLRHQHAIGLSITDLDFHGDAVVLVLEVRCGALGDAVHAIVVGEGITADSQARAQADVEPRHPTVVDGQDVVLRCFATGCCLWAERRGKTLA
jgi:hypothetical protein